MIKRYLRHRVVQNSLVLYAVQISGYLIPLITLTGLIFPLLMSGNVIVETMFGWDGARP